MINVDLLRKSHERFLRANARMLDIAADLGVDTANQHIDRYPGFKPRSGDLQRLTRGKVVRTAKGRTVRIKSSGKANKYANAIDGGARAHVIVPKRRQFLVFTGRDGRLVFVRRVNHPGNRPYKYGWRAAWAAHRVMGQFLRAEMATISRTRY